MVAGKQRSEGQGTRRMSPPGQATAMTYESPMSRIRSGQGAPLKNPGEHVRRGALLIPTRWSPPAAHGADRASG